LPRRDSRCTAIFRYYRDCDGLLRAEVRCSDVFFSDMGAAAIRFTRRGTGRPLAIAKFGTIWQAHAQLSIRELIMLAMSGNVRPGSEDSRFPCRFPAKPPIITEWHEQVYDLTGVFGIGKPQKKFFPGFPCVAGNGRGGVAPRRRKRRGGDTAVSPAQGPITPRIVAVQPPPLRPRGVLSARILHLRACPGLVRLHRRTDPCGGWIKSFRDYTTASPSGHRQGLSDVDLWERIRPVERARCRKPGRRFPPDRSRSRASRVSSALGRVWKDGVPPRRSPAHGDGSVASAG